MGNNACEVNVWGNGAARRYYDEMWLMNEVMQDVMQNVWGE